GEKTPPPPLVRPPPIPVPKETKPQPAGPMPASDALPDLIAARIGALEKTKDKVGLARAHLELALVAESQLADDPKAVMHAESALKVDPTLAPAHAILRRRLHGVKAIPAMLRHLEAEIGAATEPAGKTELLALKARLLEAAGNDAEATRNAWQQTLGHSAHHAAALKGLEIELFARTNALRGEKNDAQLEAADALQVHLAQMADAYGTEPRLAAWLHVERARILEHKLGKIDGA